MGWWMRPDQYGTWMKINNGKVTTKHHNRGPKKTRRGISFDTVREIARRLAGAEESTSYGTPAFKVKGRLFVRLHHSEPALVIAVDMDEREEMMNTSPDKFYITDHYLNYPWVLVRMSAVTGDELRDLLTGSWRRAAAGKTVERYQKRAR